MKLNRVLIAFLVLSISALLIILAYQFIYIPSSKLKEVNECTPVDFKNNSIDGGYVITWSTKSDCTGYVKYGTSDSSFPYIALDEQGVVNLKAHRVKLNGVEKGNKYYFIIISNDSTYGNNGLPIEINFN